MFSPGQRVVCVNAGTYRTLVKGKIYEVSRIFKGAVWVKDPEACMGFYFWRFAPLVKPSPRPPAGQESLVGTFPFLNPRKGARLNTRGEL